MKKVINNLEQEIAQLKSEKGQMDKVVSVPKFDGSGLLMEPSLYRSLERNQSSGLAVIGEDVERMYIASLYYRQCDPQTLEIYFVITWDIEPYITVSLKLTL